MPVFTYSAFDDSQSLVKGTIAGDSPRQARDALRERGLKIVDIKQDKAQQVSETSYFAGRRNANYVGMFTGELSTLLAVDIPLHEALKTLSQQYSGSFQKVVLLLKDDVDSGQRLATAMEKLPAVFDRLCIKMVEVGESTGRLDIVLRQLSNFRRKSMELKDRVLTSLLYPMIVLAVSLLVSVFLMTFVVPMLLENLADAGQSLPLPTMILKFMSDTLLAHGWWLAILFFGAVVAVYVALRSDWGQRLWYRLLLRLPLVGDMCRKQEISRVSLIVATLLQSGIEFLDAMNIAKGTSNNPFLRDSLKHCADAIERGKDIGTAMSELDFFPPLVVQIYTIGQSSGQLEEMLFQLSADFEQQVEIVSGRLSAVIEPLLILILAIFVGFILLATLLPILEAGNVL